MLMTDAVLAHISCPVVCTPLEQPSVSRITEPARVARPVTRNSNGRGSLAAALSRSSDLQSLSSTTAAECVMVQISVYCLHEDDPRYRRRAIGEGQGVLGA